MFKNLFDTIVGKISNLNPVKHFIKYAIDKTLNEFLQKELTLEDFRNGPLNLENIAINTEKINKSYLVGSPYVLHYGMIKNLNISLPPLSEISTQSISISISGIEITLKPNKNFSKNFKEKMIELQEYQKENVEEKEEEGEISESGPMDFFKELLRKIIMNIKVEISNIAIKLYMNTPSETKENNMQFFLMLRVPLIHVNKKEDKEKIKNDVEDIRFSIILPQISIHLLREDIKYPDYTNVKCEESDFPFRYPKVNHPSTILLIGSSIDPENIQNKINEWKTTGNMSIIKEFSQMTFRLTVDYKKKLKEIKFSFDIANFEIMVTPIQIKVISRFVAQILEFKKILESVMKELKSEASESIYLTKKKSQGNRNSASNDLFSSIMMSFSDDNHSALHSASIKEGKDIFQSMMEDKNMRESGMAFNLEFQEKINQEKRSSTASMSAEFRVINFKQGMKLDIKFSSLRAYLLKYSTNQEYYRTWLSGSEANENSINKKIGCDYFMFAMNEIEVGTDVKEKITEVKIKNLKLFNVKLHDQNHKVSAEEFFDVISSNNFSSESIKKSMVNNEIKEYEPEGQVHFCVEELLSISQNESPLKKQSSNLNQKEDPKFKKICLLPELSHSNEDNYVLYKHGVSLDIKNKDNFIKINLEIVTVSLNLEVLLDFLNVCFPLLGSRRLANVINFKRNELLKLNQNPGKSENKRSIFESSYEPVEDVEDVKDLKSESKNNFIIEVSEVKIGYRKGETCQKNQENVPISNFGHLIDKQKSAENEEELFNKVCFCDINETGIYLEVQGLIMSKKFSQIKLQTKVVDIGIMGIQNSKITSLSSIFSIKSTKHDEKIRISKDNTHGENLSAFIPELTGKFSEEDIINISSLAVDSIKIIDQLMIYKDYLEKETKLIEQQDFEVSKKAKKSETTAEKEIKIYIDRIFIELDYVQLLVEQIYVNITQQREDNIACKLSKIIAGIKKPSSVRVGLCEHINEVSCVKYYEEYNLKQNKGIADEDIFFETRDEGNSSMRYKISERDNFFNDLDQHKFNFVFNFVKRDMERCASKFTKKDSGDMSKLNFGAGKSNNLSNGTMSQKFKFNQKPFNSAIEEEGLKKVISIILQSEIRVYTCNIFEIAHHAKKIEQLADYIKSKIKEAEEKLKSQTILLMERKHSVEIESESLEISFNMYSPILVEIRPDFTKNPKEKIYSNMRSIVCINLNQDLSIEINKDKNQKEIGGEISLAYYFLRHEDREIDLNPIRIPKEENLEQLGFKKILEINQMSFKTSLFDSNKTLNIKIKEIFGELSLETICFLELHFEHFINHHIKNEMGQTFIEIFTGDEFEELECLEDSNLDEANNIIIVGEEMEEDEFIIEDLTGAEEVYREKIVQKEKDEKEIKIKPITFTKCQNPQISVDCFEVDNICFRISSRKDFNFAVFKGVALSAAENRCRVKDNVESEYYSLLLKGVSLVVDLEEEKKEMKMIESSSSQPCDLDVKESSKTINSLVKIESVKIVHNKQKPLPINDFKYMRNLSTDGGFLILENERPISILFEKNEKKTYLKSYNMKLSVGVTTDLIDIFKHFEKARKEISKSCWKKIYKTINQNTKQEEQSRHIDIRKIDCKKDNKRLVIYLPESSLKLTFKKYGIKILDEQALTIKEFLLNEEIGNSYQMKISTRKYFKELIKTNIGGLIGGTAINLFYKLFSQLISLNIKWLSLVLGFFSNFSE